MFLYSIFKSVLSTYSFFFRFYLPVVTIPFRSFTSSTGWSLNTDTVGQGKCRGFRATLLLHLHLHGAYTQIKIIDSSKIYSNTTISTIGRWNRGKRRKNDDRGPRWSEKSLANKLTVLNNGCCVVIFKCLFKGDNKSYFIIMVLSMAYDSEYNSTTIIRARA